MSTTPSTPPVENERIARYKIVRLLGSGGMGEIHEAVIDGFAHFEKRVVVKLLRPELAARPEHIQAFFDEARIAATLNHSNIVQLFDVGLDGARAYLAMEFLDGVDLAHLLTLLSTRGARMPTAQAITIVAAVASGLAHAHAMADTTGASLEIVHRDVSPSNVFITREGVVKVIDFGIARARDKIAKTTFGTIKGKLEYMSPEQCRGDQVDAKSDVFSLGAVLHEILSGAPPHRGTDDYEIRKAIVEGEPASLAESVPSCPEALAELVQGMLAKAPEQRPTARTVAARLVEIGREERWDLSTFALAAFVRGAVDGDIEAISRAPTVAVSAERVARTGEPQSGSQRSRVASIRRIAGGAVVFFAGFGLATLLLRDAPKPSTTVSTAAAAVASTEPTTTEARIEPVPTAAPTAEEIERPVGSAVADTRDVSDRRPTARAGSTARPSVPKATATASARNLPADPDAALPR